jgi:GTP-binding protein Era
VAQTTRNLVRGILTEPRGQLALMDTPGIHKAQNELGRLMNKMARSVVEGSDLVVLVLDAAVAPRIEDDGWLRRLLFAAPPLLFVFNKADCGPLYIDAYRQLWQDIQKEKEQEAEPDFGLDL